MRKTTMTKRIEYIPERGDLVWVNFNPTKGHEQNGERPAFVISPKIYNEKAGLVLLCPVTSKIKGYPFEVELKGNNIGGAILTDQIRSVDWRARRVKKIESVPVSLAQEVRAKILALVS
jgi:mRNA interferase MazF